MLRVGRYSLLVVPIAVLAAIAGACSAPPSLVGLGEHQAQISPLAPVTYFYDGTAGEALNVSFSTEPCAMNGACPTVTISGPQGEAVATGARSGWTGTLPTTGRYKLVFQMDGPFSSGPYGLRVWLSVDIDGGPISPGTYPYPDLPAAHRIAYTYAGVAGQILHLTTDCSLMEFRVRDPSGAIIASSSRAPLDVVLPADGTYRVSLGNCFQQPSTFTLAVD